ncbi:ATP-binding cassette domain-containing protein [Laceyella putida]|uniref:ATP-binding cassette domain-containing protein n=1 Tax=Laceyella putida TaxID=110101 RepID=A0ABW2RL84_9BACL
MPSAQVDTSSYQDRIAVLFQDFNRYNLTVRENIGFGRISELSATKHITAAATKAGIHPTIEQLPKQYASELGKFFNEGNELSGGQWQKLAIARAFFRNSDLIILDEPTSALDPRAEIEIIDHFFSMAQDKAIILITHRLGPVSQADEILVMEDGKVVEQGSHAELISLGGNYAKMYETQSRWYQAN